MPPLLAIATALSALGLLVMLIAAALLPKRASGDASERVFGVGYGIFCLALIFWMVVSLLAFFAQAKMHGG